MSTLALTKQESLDHWPELFLHDEIRAAYHLALLEWPYSRYAAWQHHHGPDGEIDAAVTFYSLSRPTIVFLLGDASSVAECLAAAEPPGCAYLAFFPEHASMLNGFYRMPRHTQMTRMVLRRDDFERRAEASGGDPRTVVLDGGRTHLAPLEELYSHEAGLRPDRYQFDRGRYVGIFDRGKLVSAAGTHFVSRNGSFAMIGNVFTHPDHRQEGLGRAAVIELLRRTFAGVQKVCLNVRTSNRAAVNLYESLGFAAHCTYCEGMSVLGPALATAAPKPPSGEF